MLVVQKFSTILVAIAIASGVSGCDETMMKRAQTGVPLSELEFGGAAPSVVSLAGPDRVILTEGDTFSVSVEGDPETTEKLRFEREGESFNIRRESGINISSDAAIIRVTMPAPETIRLSGSGVIEAPAMASSATIKSSGSGTVRVAAFEAETLDIAQSGSGTVSGSGRTDRLDLAISGSGTSDLQNLSVEEADIRISGSGDAAFASDGRVNASIAGSGDVTVRGTAKCASSAAGSGKLVCSPTG